MKIRKGFVSNSSSSSFVCEVCGEVESGWDAGLGDFDMCRCVNGHTMHESELLENHSIGVCEDDEESVEPVDDERYNVSEKYCPICTLAVIPDKYILEYVYQYIKPKNEIMDLIRQTKKVQKE